MSLRTSKPITSPGSVASSRVTDRGLPGASDPAARLLTIPRHTPVETHLPRLSPRLTRVKGRLWRSRGDDTGFPRSILVYANGTPPMTPMAPSGRHPPPGGVLSPPLGARGSTNGAGLFLKGH